MQRFKSEFKINCGVKVQCKPTVRFYNGIVLLGPPASDSRIETSSAMLCIIDAKKRIRDLIAVKSQMLLAFNH